jgi:protein-tyrosine phosphatase
MAEVVLRDQLDRAGLAGRVVVDSAGTGGWHVGSPMDRKARSELARHGYDGESHRARQFDPGWLPGRDLILAMDTANLRDLRDMATATDAPRIRLFGEVAGLAGVEVPDPYYGTTADFARVLSLLEEGMARLAGKLRAVTTVSPARTADT